MRIIAGKHRGRVLAQFRGADVRPTSDRAKESLFQILGTQLSGARVLDLFCGSGALGLESLSRGAREAVFNDLSRDSLAILRKNLAALGETGTVCNLDFRACLARAEGKFDVIFADPPYAMDVSGEALELIARRRLLAEDGLVVWESEREEVAPAGWQIADRRRYGRAKVVFFREQREVAP